MTPRCDRLRGRRRCGRRRSSPAAPRSSRVRSGLICVQSIRRWWSSRACWSRRTACADRSAKTAAASSAAARSRVARRRHLLHLARPPIEARDLAAVDDVRVQRIGRDVAVLLDADRRQSRNVICPWSPRLATHADPLSCCPPHTRYGNALSATHVVELRRRLVVPGAPRLAAVDA